MRRIGELRKLMAKSFQIRRDMQFWIDERNDDGLRKKIKEMRQVLDQMELSLAQGHADDKADMERET